MAACALRRHVRKDMAISHLNKLTKRIDFMQQTVVANHWPGHPDGQHKPAASYSYAVTANAASGQPAARRSPSGSLRRRTGRCAETSACRPRDRGRSARAAWPLSSLTRPVHSTSQSGTGNAHGSDRSTSARASRGGRLARLSGAANEGRRVRERRGRARGLAGKGRSAFT